MNKNIITLLAQKIKEYRFGKIRSAVSVLLIITVAGGTVFSLRKPAITMSSDEVHYHTMECYDWDASPPEWTDYLFCNADRLGIHKHTDTCFVSDENGHKTLICGIADYVVHVHGEECTDRDGNLVCGLAECLPLDPNGGYSHEHTIECYQPDGFTYEKVLMPTASDSDATAESQIAVSVDGSGAKPASPSNASVPAAKAAPKASASDAADTTLETVADTDEETAITSREKEKLLKEIQSYQEIIPEKLILTGVLICGLEADSDDEIDWDEVEDDELEDYLPDEIPLVDDIHPMPAAVRSAPKEGVIHEHDDSCYDTDDTLICGLLETQEHIHDESCYITCPPLICEEYGVHLLIATSSSARKAARRMAAATADTDQAQILVRILDAAWKPDTTQTDTSSDSETDAEIDAEEVNLPGAKFILYRYDTTSGFEEVASYTTDEDALLIDGLDYDTVYKLEQTSAPAGYSLAADCKPYYFYISSEDIEEGMIEESTEEEITEESTDAGIMAVMAVDLDDEESTDEESANKTITVEGIDADEINTLEAGTTIMLYSAEATGYTLPETGGSGTIPYTMGGLMIIFTSVGAFMYQRQRRKEGE